MHVLGDLRGVAALVLGGLDLEADEARAEALDLLLDRGADVVRLDDRAEAARGRDRLEPGDAGAQDQHAGRRDRARGRHEHRQEAGEPVGGHERGLVAGHRGLRRQRVHLLRARDARDQLHAQRGDAAVGEAAHQVGLGQRVEHRDQHGAFGEQLDLVAAERIVPAGTAHLQDELRLPKQRGGVRHHHGSRLPIGVIIRAGAPAGAGFDPDVEASLLQSGHPLGYQRHPSLPTHDLLWNRNSHGSSRGMIQRGTERAATAAGPGPLPQSNTPRAGCQGTRPAGRHRVRSRIRATLARRWGARDRASRGRGCAPAA